METLLPTHLLHAHCADPMNRRHFCSVAASLVATTLTSRLAAAQPAGALTDAAQRVARRVLTSDLGRKYTDDAALQEILRFASAISAPALQHGVVDVANRRGWTDPARIWLAPFCNLPLALYHATGESRYREAFLREFSRQRTAAVFAPGGAVLHPMGRYGQGDAILIDGMQEFAARLAWAERLTGGNRFAAAVEQFSLYRTELRDPHTGLWSNGRGWVPGAPSALSPNAWSRGHGWLTRGMLHTLEAIPRADPQHERLTGLFGEVLDALVPRQRADGWFPCLLDLSPDESPIETSGSALIAAALANGVVRNYAARESQRATWAACARRTFAVLPSSVLEDGRVSGVSPGPGPLQSVEKYRNVAPFGPDPHGDFALLAGATAALALHHAGPGRQSP